LQPLFLIRYKRYIPQDRPDGKTDFCSHILRRRTKDPVDGAKKLALYTPINCIDLRREIADSIIPTAGYHATKR
jgi:hypothetical protein